MQAKQSGPEVMLALTSAAFHILLAIAKHISELFDRKQPILPTMRHSMVATFSAFVLFTFACAIVGRTADPILPFNAVGQAHPEVRIAFAIVNYGYDIAFLAVVLGGLPILFVAACQAIAKGPRVLFKLFLPRPKQALCLLAAALLITICFLAYLLGTQFLFSSPCTPVNHCGLAEQTPGYLIFSFAALIGAFTLGIFVILTITAALSLAVLRSEFSTKLLFFALEPIALLTITMGSVTLATTTWLIRLWIDAPQFAASSSGLGNGQTAWIVATIGAMLLATLVSFRAFTNGIHAWRRRDAPARI